MASYTVRCKFNDGSGDYTFPLLQTISDPKEMSKGVIHEGTRGNGSVFIPGGRKSQTIKISGFIADNDGYEDITSQLNSLKSEVTVLPGTLTLEHWDPNASAGGAWTTDWQYTVVRNSEIEINDNNEMRTDKISYSCEFLVLTY